MKLPPVKTQIFLFTCKEWKAGNWGFKCVKEELHVAFQSFLRMILQRRLTALLRKRTKEGLGTKGSYPWKCNYTWRFKSSQEWNCNAGRPDTSVKDGYKKVVQNTFDVIQMHSSCFIIKDFRQRQRWAHQIKITIDCHSFHQCHIIALSEFFFNLFKASVTIPIHRFCGVMLQNEEFHVI